MIDMPLPRLQDFSRGACIVRTFYRRFKPVLVALREGTATITTIYDTEQGLLRVLSVDGHYQSASYLDERRFSPPFEYYRSFEWLFELRENTTPPQTALLLGGGGFSWPKWSLTEHPSLHMDVVEYDPAIVEIARHWFFLNELEEVALNRLHIHTMDGRTYLERCAERRYDLIVNDSFCGAHPVQKLASLEAIQLVYAHLQPGGLYASNIVSADERSDLSWLYACVSTLNQVFKQVLVFDSSDEHFSKEYNFLVVASDGVLSVSEKLAARCITYDKAELGKVLHDPPEHSLSCFSR